VADASHELRTPVTTIRGYAELYRAGGLDDAAELGEAMRRTEQEAVRMGSLVDDLLHLARLDQGRPLDRQPVDLSVVAEDAVRDAGAVEPERPITVTVDGPAVVTGDDGRLRQVVANLVGNALVHTPPESTLSLSAEVAGDRALIEVSDTGPGIPLEKQERIFDRFYRGPSPHSDGFGLGLAIAYQAVRALGGVLDVKSSPGTGTTARIELPSAIAPRQVA
jgi:two-component system OmpR family sensor kinase